MTTNNAPNWLPKEGLMTHHNGKYWRVKNGQWVEVSIDDMHQIAAKNKRRNDYNRSMKGLI